MGAITGTTPQVESSAEEQERAAVEIQRYYRGHRTRRHLKGHGLTPDQRWHEALKDAHYRQVALPVSREGRLSVRPSASGTGGENSSEKRRISKSKEKWDRAVLFARQAQHDDEPSSSGSSEDENEDEDSKKKREEKRAKKLQKRKERIEYSKAMDMQYFLEMVDLKHRYGSNLRAYHSYWQSQPTLENFFYWLDHGSGRSLDLTICPRSRLDSECVRYLSREERLSYLVKIDSDGRLCWDKNGERIDTTAKYHDSAAGIIPVDTGDATTTSSIYVENSHCGARESSNTLTSISSSSDSCPSGSETSDSDEAKRYANLSLNDHHGPKKVFHVSASTVLNRLLRKTTKKNTWIFVVDNSFRLYVGIKQSGAFQHSSFLHGARVSAAGLIKIKEGRLKSLSPLSGHYRPPANNFRKFVKSLREANVDMSHVSISKSYAILVGLEAYGNLRKGKKKTKHAIQNTADKMLPSGTMHSMHNGKEDEHIKEQYQIDKPTHYSPDGAADTEKGGPPDKALKKKINKEEKQRDENGFAFRFMKMFHMKPKVPKTAAEVKSKKKRGIFGP